MIDQPLTSITPATADLARERPLAYRSVLTTFEPLALEKIRATALAWVAEKYGAVPAASGRHQLANHVVFSNDTTYAIDGHERALRFQLREDNSEATWRTTVTAVRMEAVTHVSVSLEAFPRTVTPLLIARPRLVRTLVSVLDPVDGPAVLTLAPIKIAEPEVPRLVDILCDLGRRKPAVVAARPVLSAPEWLQRLEKIAYQSAGAASFYLLTDPDAIGAFRAEIGEEHRVATASVRNFLPEVDPAWAPDARRHRFITAHNFSDPAYDGWRFLPMNLQRIDTAAPLPDALRTVAFPEIDTDRHEQRRNAIQLARVSENADALRAEVDELKELLAQVDADISSLNENYSFAQRTIASLEEQHADALAQSELDAAEALEAMDEAERSRNEAALLRSRLYAQDRYEEAEFDANALRGAPTSFEEVFEWAKADLSGLTVTADRTITVDLDKHERSATWAAKAWKGLRALNAYAQGHKDVAGGFYEYCKSGRGEHGWPAKEVAMTESETTMHNWGAQRVFRVPKAIDPDGTATMQAHLQLERKGSTCPRIHFLDDTKGATGKIIVGYIGPHLTNTKTN